MARAMWKGSLQFDRQFDGRFDDWQVPVKLYAGIEDRKVHFRLLHQSDQIPVTQKMIHPQTGKEVAPGEIRRAYAIERGRFVVMNPADLAALEPDKSREIRIIAFVDPDRIGHQYYDRPYYLGPDSGAPAYFTFAAALAKSSAVAIARWNMRKKAYCGVMRPDQGYLQLITLRYQDQVADTSDLTRPEFRELEDQERRMAEQLVQALENRFIASEYRDQYRDRVLELIRTKARGGRIDIKPAPEAKPRVVSLAEMLEQSVQQARRERKVG